MLRNETGGHPIIALWTYPRTISTAFERVMMERGDLEVQHEPFSYVYYVRGNNASIAQEYVDPDHPTAYPDVKQMLIDAAQKRPVFFKDMAAHCYADLIADSAFLERITHSFLIRDPAKTIASFYALNPDVAQDEIGCEQLAGLFEAVCKIQASPPPVVDADDLEDFPEGTVAAYCRNIRIAHIPDSLRWEPRRPDQWKIWQNWHADAARSCGIIKDLEKFEVTVENSSHLRSYHDYHLPFYRKLKQFRIQPVGIEKDD